MLDVIILLLNLLNIISDLVKIWGFKPFFRIFSSISAVAVASVSQNTGFNTVVINIGCELAKSTDTICWPL